MIRCIVLALALVGFVRGDEKKPTLTGTIEFSDKDVALGEDARIVVKLQDTSLADARAIDLGMQEIKNPGKPPVKFAVEYDPAKITPRGRYTMSVSVYQKDKDGKEARYYLNTTSFSAFKDGKPIENLKVVVDKIKKN